MDGNIFLINCCSSIYCKVSTVIMQRSPNPRCHSHLTIAVAFACFCMLLLHKPNTMRLWFPNSCMVTTSWNPIICGNVKRYINYQLYIYINQCKSHTNRTWIYIYIYIAAIIWYNPCPEHFPYIIAIIKEYNRLIHVLHIAIFFIYIYIPSIETSSATRLLSPLRHRGPGGRAARGAPQQGRQPLLSAGAAHGAHGVLRPLLSAAQGLSILLCGNRSLTEKSWTVNKNLEIG